MAYEKQNFTSGRVLKASELDHIEDGIIALENELAEAKKSLVEDVIAALPTAEGASF